MNNHARTTSGRRVLVTGGTGGIGGAVAQAFASTGDLVIATGATEAEVQSVPETEGVSTAVMDVTDADQVHRLVDSLDQLDVLVNCAGTILRNGQEHVADSFQHVVDVNLNGTMRVCEACCPLLTASAGCVVNTASMLSFFGGGHAPGYSASKGGVAQLTKSLAIAWADQGVRVNAVAPGWIETAMTQPLREDAERNRRILERTPLGRWGRPDDVTGAVMFLCSLEAAFITGVVLPVDGGYAIA